MNFFKKFKWVFIGIFFVSILIISFLFTKRNSLVPGQNTSQPSENNSSNSSAPRDLPISFNQINPGVSTKELVIKDLGQPINSALVNGLTEDFYKNPNSLNRKHVIISNAAGVVVFVREVITSNDTKSVKSITDIYGKPPVVLYGPDQEAGIFLYSYPDRGVAMLANMEVKDPVLFEIWYFQPTDSDSFLKLWAIEYKTIPTSEDQF